MLHPLYHLGRYNKIRVELSFVRIRLMANWWRIFSGLSSMQTILRPQEQIPFTDPLHISLDLTCFLFQHALCITSSSLAVVCMCLFLMAHPPSGPGPLPGLGCTITLRHTTLGRTPLYEWSARRWDLYLTTLTRDRRPCPRRNSNPQFQQASGRRPTLYTTPQLGMVNNNNNNNNNNNRQLYLEHHTYV